MSKFEIIKKLLDKKGVIGYNGINNAILPKELNKLKKTITRTVRNIPTDEYRKLRRLAAYEETSINTEILKGIKERAKYGRKYE